MSEELPRYTADNLEAWAEALRALRGEEGKTASHAETLEALDGAARFMEDTVATLRSQAKLRQKRAAERAIQRKRTNGRRGRRRR